MQCKPYDENFNDIMSREARNKNLRNNFENLRKKRRVY